MEEKLPGAEALPADVTTPAEEAAAAERGPARSESPAPSHDDPSGWGVGPADARPHDDAGRPRTTSPGEAAGAAKAPASESAADAAKAPASETAAGAASKIIAGEIVGIVRDASTNEPLADIVVSLSAPPGRDENLLVTDRHGAFRFPRSAPGKYLIWFEGENYRSVRTEIRLRPGARLRFEARLLYDDAAEETTITIRE